MNMDRPGESLHAVLRVIEDQSWCTGTEYMTNRPPGEIRKKIDQAIQSREDQGLFLEAARIMMFRLSERNNPKTLQLYDRAIQQELSRGHTHDAANIAYEARYFTRASELYRTAGNHEMARFAERLQPLERELKETG